MSEHENYVNELTVTMQALQWSVKLLRGEQRTMAFLIQNEVELAVTVEHGLNAIDIVRVQHKSPWIRTNSCVYPIKHFNLTQLSHHVLAGGHLPTELEMRSWAI